MSKNSYTSSTTAEDVFKNEKVDLKGKVIFITGSNTGIGKETARVLSYSGAKIYMAARDTKKMQNAINEIKKENKNADLVGLELDLGDSKSIEKCVKEFLKQEQSLNILINNAGVMATPERKTKDGYEYQFGINHLGHFRLTLLLLPVLKASALKEGEGRIVNLSSEAHRMGKQIIHFDNISLKGNYAKWEAYGQSKLANILFSNELNKRFKNENIPITVNSLHPGVIKTELMRDNEGFLVSIAFWIGSLFMKSIPQGAATTVYCAIAKELKGKGGEYHCDCNQYPAVKYAYNEENMKKLFDVSENMTGVSYEKQVKFELDEYIKEFSEVSVSENKESNENVEEVKKDVVEEEKKESVEEEKQESNE